MPDPAAPSDQSLLACVEPLLREGKPVLTLGEIMKHIEGHDGPGPVLFILTLPVLLPLPPGFSMVMALPLLIVTPQIMIGRSALWMPQWLAKRDIKRDELHKVVKRASPVVQKIEGAAHPRLGYFTGRAGRCATGAACTVIALVLVLPLPFANLAPSVAMAVFAIGLARKDGLFVVAGYGLMILAAVVIAWGAHGAALGLHHLLALI